MHQFDPRTIDHAATTSARAPRRPELGIGVAVGAGTGRADQIAADAARRAMLVDGMAAVSAAIEDERWLESLALVECLLRPASAEALRHATDPEWSNLIRQATHEWRLLRNAGVDWHTRRATADTPLRVAPGSPLWQAAREGLELLADLTATTTEQPFGDHPISDRNHC